MKMKCGKNIFFIFAAVVLTFFACGCSGSANDADTLLQMAANSAQNGKNSDALMLAKEACMLSPDNVEALLMRSIMAERCGEKASALDSALQAVKIAPNHVGALYTVGRLYSYNKDTAAEAVNYLEKALTFNPNDINTLILLSNLSVALKSEKSLDYISKLQSLDSELVNTFEGQTLLAHAYAIRGKKREATLTFGIISRKWANVLSNYNYAVALDCLYNNTSIVAEKYKLFLEQSASDPKFDKLRKDVERRLKKLPQQQKNSRRRR